MYEKIKNNQNKVKTMKRISIIFITLMLCNIMTGQTAQNVLDKIAATISNKSGISANFKITNGQQMNFSGTISVKGKKFYATTAQADIWFDGKTQWTYMKSNKEVNISTPNESQLQAINPYNFINIYKNGFTYTMKTSGSNYEIHLTATNNKRNIQEMYIYANKNTYVPSQIKMRQGTKWNTITISNFKKAALNDNLFRFSHNKYPEAEIIDLR